MNKTLNLIFGLFLAIGFAFSGISLWAIRDTQAFVAKAATAQGEVTGLEYGRDNSSSRGVYYPVVKFRTATGEAHTFRSNSGSSPPGYRVGEAVSVLYDPANPFDARIKGFFSLWFLAFIFGVIGSVFALVGFGGLIVPRLLTRRAHELQLHGTPVETDFQNVELNGAFRVNGRSPWRIVSHAASIPRVTSCICFTARTCGSTRRPSSPRSASPCSSIRTI